MSITGRVAGLVAIAALHAYWFLQPIPTTFKALAAALVVLSLVRPAAGLIAFAAIAPLSTVIANQFGGFGMGAQLLEQVALAISAGVLLHRSFDTPTRIGAPAAVVAAVSLASAAAIIVSAIWLPIQDGRTPVVMAQFWNRRLAQTSPFWAPALVAIAAITCAFLAWAAERIVRQKPRLVSQVLMAGLVGHAVSAVLSLNAIRELALQDSAGLRAAFPAMRELTLHDSANFWVAFPTLLRAARISVQMPNDVHAAASALLLAGIAGLGLLTGSWKKRTALVSLVALIVIGMWITGSRMAMLLAGVSTMAAVGWWAAQRSRRHLVVALVAMGAVAATIWIAMFAVSLRYNSAAVSFNARVVMMKAGIQMFKSSPVFGIGITRFYLESPGFAGPDIATVVGYVRENAHNNFIQVLAEQGLVGLAAMLWWLAAMIVSGARAQIAKPDAQRGALLLAIMACAGTWLVSHPLLVPEFALVFWMYGGVLAAMTPIAKSQATGRRHWIVGALIAALFLTVPFRATGIRNAAYLEHHGVGVSIWHHDDTQRYREAGAAFSLYLPSGDAPAVLPIRRAPGSADPLAIDVGIGGRHLTTIAIEGDGWHDVAIVVPKSSRLFELVDFSVHPPASTAEAPKVLLRIGRTAPR